MKREAPEWLAAFQKQFGNVIRTPLDRATGTLTATTNLYDARIASDVADATNAKAVDRLAVYNRQYWFRLFNVLHDAFPLTTRLMGFWEFNEVAARFFEANAPRGWDLEDATKDFETFFAAAISNANRAETTSDGELALSEAAHIDAAYRRIFHAPQSAPFRPSAEDAARLLDMKLTPSPALAIVVEHFPLLELRKTILENRSDARAATPAALAMPRAWALLRADRGTIQFALELREAELLQLLERFTVRDALAELERNCTDDERAHLPEKIREWLARSVQREFWRAPN